MVATNPAVGSHQLNTPVSGQSGASLIAKFFTSPAKGLEARGRRIANAHLALYSDEQLHQLGYDQARISEIRQAEQLGAVAG